MTELLDGPGGVASEELNATVLDWPPGHSTPEHRNDARDVLVVVLRGSIIVHVDGVEHDRAAGEALVVERGASRRFVVGADGARVLTAHRRRPGLMPATASTGTTVEIDSLLDALQAPAPSAAGGTAAAAAAAMAASLVVMIARGSPAWPDADAVAAGATSTRNRLLRLGAQDVDAFAGVLAAYRAQGDATAPSLADALLLASRVPLQIAESAADVVQLAAQAYGAGKPSMRPDASAAAILSEAATRAAAQLVGVNLAGLPAGPDDDERARLLEAAAAAEARALAGRPSAD